MAPPGKSTKEILSEALASRGRSPLYDPVALEAIGRRLDAWKLTQLSPRIRENWLATPRTILGSDIPRELLYTPLSNPSLDYVEDLGNPGEMPFARGIHASMYRGKEFTMRQLTGFGGPEETNERIKFMLSHGATGVNVVFDLPTIQMYDSDDPVSKGQVGMSGVAVDTVDDMDLLFAGIPLDEVSVSLVTHYPSNTAILFPMYLALAERRGIPWDKLRGSVQNDIVLEEVVRSGPEYIPPRDCYRIQCDNIEFMRRHVPRWNVVTYNGYNLREFGTSGVMEMAVALTNAIATIEELVSRGHDVDEVAERLAFFWSPASDFFEEIARLRAVRRLWARIVKYRFGAKRDRSLLMRCHVQTSGVSLTREEPHNNIVRAAYHALASILGGAQSLHVDSYDEAYSVPTEDAALVALRTQQIIQAETGVTEVVDPLGGSFYVEALTNECERRILDAVDEIEQHGGLVAAIESGELHSKVADFFSSERRGIENGDIRVVGLNTHKAAQSTPLTNVFEYPEGVEERQRVRLARRRVERDSQKANAALECLERACRMGENVMAAGVDCARSGCTEGEMFSVLKRAFGLWRPPVRW